MFATPLWFEEPAVQPREEAECFCIRIGVDLYDARWCPAHGERRESGVRLVGGGDEECPF